jgi:hypothetical protein
MTLENGNDYLDQHKKEQFSLLSTNLVDALKNMESKEAV